MKIPLCHRNHVPYSHTILPGVINTFGPLDESDSSSSTAVTTYSSSGTEIEKSAIEEEIQKFEPLISVKCYSLLPLFLCSLYAPKCSLRSGNAVPPCRSVCKGKFQLLSSKKLSLPIITFPSTEAVRKCSFFLNVFNLHWPRGLDCDSFPDSPDPAVCVGRMENDIIVMKSECKQ